MELDNSKTFKSSPVGAIQQLYFLAEFSLLQLFTPHTKEPKHWSSFLQIPAPSEHGSSSVQHSSMLPLQLLPDQVSKWKIDEWNYLLLIKNTYCTY